MSADRLHQFLFLQTQQQDNSGVRFMVRKESRILLRRSLRMVWEALKMWALVRL